MSQFICNLESHCDKNRPDDIEEKYHSGYIFSSKKYYHKTEYCHDETEKTHISEYVIICVFCSEYEAKKWNLPEDNQATLVLLLGCYFLCSDESVFYSRTVKYIHESYTFSPVSPCCAIYECSKYKKSEYCSDDIIE